LLEEANAAPAALILVNVKSPGGSVDKKITGVSQLKFSGSGSYIASVFDFKCQITDLKKFLRLGHFFP
jgi:hypothetical protein